MWQLSHVCRATEASDGVAFLIASNDDVAYDDNVDDSCSQFIGKKNLIPYHINCSQIVYIYLLGGWSCDGPVPYGPQYSARQLLNCFVHWRVSKMDVRGNRTIYKSSVHSSPEERVASCQDITIQLDRINVLDVFLKCCYIEGKRRVA